MSIYKQIDVNSIFFNYYIHTNRLHTHPSTIPNAIKANIISPQNVSSVNYISKSGIKSLNPTWI